MRLGTYPCKLMEGSVARSLYDNNEIIYERHRHRYEVNNDFRAKLEEKGLVFSGTSPDNRLVEIIELKDLSLLRSYPGTPGIQVPPNQTTSTVHGSD